MKKNGKRVRVTRYILPSIGSGAKAGNLKTIKPDLTVSLTASPAPGAYPITTTTWILAYSNYAAAGKSSTSRDDVKKVLNFVYSSAAQAQLATLRFAAAVPGAPRRGQGADQEDQVDGRSTAAAEPPGPAAARRSLRRPPLGLAADRGYLVITAVAAVGALVGIGYLIWKTVSQTGDIWSTYGVWGFLTGTRVDPASRWTPRPSSARPRSSTARS